MEFGSLDIRYPCSLLVWPKLSKIRSTDIKFLVLMYEKANIFYSYELCLRICCNVRMAKFSDLYALKGYLGSDSLHVGVIGINHKVADLSLRERFAQIGTRRFHPSSSLHGEQICLPLSTCNRTEVYFSSHDLAATHSYILDVLRAKIDRGFEQKLYSFFGAQCFFHLARVTAGIDSAVIGETEIQGQVKQAYEEARLHLLLPSVMHYMFQKSLQIGKKIRSSKWPLSSVAVQEEAILRTCLEEFSDLATCKILFLGASRINRKFFEKCRQEGVERLTICNRTFDKAEKWSGHGVNVLPWEVRNTWQDYDIIVTGTKSPHYLIEKEEVGHLTKKKLLIDLSVPRNIHPELALHPHIQLWDIDRLQRRAQTLAPCHEEQVYRVEEAILREVRNYTDRFARRPARDAAYMPGGYYG